MLKLDVILYPAHYAARCLPTTLQYPITFSKIQNNRRGIFTRFPFGGSFEEISINGGDIVGHQIDTMAKNFSILSNIHDSKCLDSLSLTCYQGD